MQTLKNLRRLKLMLLLPVLLVTACATNSPALPPLPVREARIPALPHQARQPTTPPWCLPTCSSALMRERESWLNSLPEPTKPGKSAKPVTTP